MPSPSSPEIDRHLPHNLDAERSVLGACLLHADTVPEVAKALEPRDFHLHRHEVIFRAILATHADRGATDPIVVGEELGRLGKLEEAGGYPHLLDLLESVVTAAGVHYHVEIVAEKARLRRLIDSCRDVVHRAQGGTPATELATDLAKAAERERVSSFARLPLLSLADLGAMGQRGQLVDGLIFADSLNAFCGMQKSFKTVIADALCVAVAEAGEFLGRRVLHPGLVIDFALEGMGGKPARYRAHLGVARFNDTTDVVHRRLFLHGTAPDITATAGQDLVLRTIEEWQKKTGEPLRLTKWDTVARAMSVARLDENSTQDMGAWIAGLDRIRSRIQHAQLLVHHTGRSGLERGSTALPGAVDLLAMVEKTGRCEARFRVRDARDLEVPNPLLIRLSPVVVGQYPDGRPVTAMRVDTVNETVAEAHDETPRKSTTKQALLELADQSGTEGFDFPAAMAATGKVKSTTSQALAGLGGTHLQEFQATDGTKRWRRRVS